VNENRRRDEEMERAQHGDGGQQPSRGNQGLRLVVLGAVVSLASAIVSGYAVWVADSTLEVTASSLEVAGSSLRDQYEWNRRHYAIEMLREWNTQTAVHKAALECAYSELYSAPGWKMDVTEARALYFAECKLPDGTTPNPKWELRNHVIALLNYFEYVAKACEVEVADAEVIEATHKGTMIRWHDQLHAFIVTVKEARDGKSPWLPFERIVDEWRPPEERPSDPRPLGKPK
jgi:hypothetical protein